MSDFTAIESSPDSEYLNSYATKTIENVLVNLSSQQDHIILGLCGGRSVSPIFELLSKNTNIPWSKVHFFMVDERLVRIDSDESNYKLASQFLIEPLKEARLITDFNCHPFILNSYADDYGVSAYSKELKDFGGQFDLAILSGGEDGHIGAIYPDHHSFEDGSNFYTFMTDSPKPPPERMTASKQLILRTQAAVLLVMGESKKELYNRLFDESVLPEDCPAKLVTQLPESYLITTHSA